MLYNTGIIAKSNTNKTYMQVDVASASKVTSLLINNYRSPVTPIREAIVNGLEAVADVADGEVTATFTTTSQGSSSIFGGEGDKNINTITIADNGCGMSHNFVTERFLMLTNSTKDKDEQAAGGFGIGSKAVMSISTSTVFRTVHNGEATVIVLGLDQNGVTQEVSDPVDTDEPNGTTVTVHVDDDTMRAIRKNIGREFLDYLDSTTPLTVTVEENGEKYTLPVGKYHDTVAFSHTATNGITVNLFYADLPSYKAVSIVEWCRIRVSDMPYPLSSAMVEESIGDNRWFDHPQLGSLNLNGNIQAIFDVPPHMVIVSSSRESVVDTTDLTLAIAEAYRESVMAAAHQAGKMIAEATTPEQWRDGLGQLEELFDHHAYISNMRKTAKFATENKGKRVALIYSDPKGYPNFSITLKKFTMDEMHSYFDGIGVDSITSLYRNSTTAEEFTGIKGNPDFIAVVRENIGIYSWIPFLPTVVSDTLVTPSESDAYMAIVEWCGMTATHTRRGYDSIRHSMMSRGRSKGSKKGKRGGVSVNDYRFYLMDKDSGECVTGSRKDFADMIAAVDKTGATHINIVRFSYGSLLEDSSSDNYKNALKATRISHYMGSAIIFVESQRSDVFDKDCDMILQSLGNKHTFSTSNKGKVDHNCWETIRELQNLAKGEQSLELGEALGRCFNPEHSETHLSTRTLVNITIDGEPMYKKIAEFLALDSDKLGQAITRNIEIIDLLAEDDKEVLSDYTVSVSALTKYVNTLFSYTRKGSYSFNSALMELSHDEKSTRHNAMLLDAGTRSLSDIINGNEEEYVRYSLSHIYLSLDKSGIFMDSALSLARSMKGSEAVSNIININK